MLSLQGGKFVLTVKGEDLPQLDQWWLHAVLSAIGETLEVRDDGGAERAEPPRTPYRPK